MKNKTLIKIYKDIGIPNIEAKTTIKQYLQAILNSEPLDIKQIQAVLKQKYNVVASYDTIRGRLAELKKEGIAISKKGRFRFQVLWSKTHLGIETGQDSATQDQPITTIN